MDCRDMGVLANTCKTPLGLVFDILLAAYVEDMQLLHQGYTREAEALKLLCVEEWKEPGGPSSTTEWVARLRAWGLDEEDAFEFFGDNAEKMIAWWRERPEGRCTYRLGCQGRPHRFAMHAACPRHHGGKYCASYRPAQMQPWHAQ